MRFRPSRHTSKRGRSQHRSFDGPSTLLPIPRHRAPSGGSLSEDQKTKTAPSCIVPCAIIRSGAALPRARILPGLGSAPRPASHPLRRSICLLPEEPATRRESSEEFVEKAAQATLVGDVFDDAATGQGLLNFLLRGVNCGAFTENEAAASGLTLDELRGRSFLKIMEARRAT